MNICVFWDIEINELPRIDEKMNEEIKLVILLRSIKHIYPLGVCIQTQIHIYGNFQNSVANDKLWDLEQRDTT